MFIVLSIPVKLGANFLLVLMDGSTMQQIYLEKRWKATDYHGIPNGEISHKEAQWYCGVYFNIFFLCCSCYCEYQGNAVFKKPVKNTFLLLPIHS